MTTRVRSNCYREARREYDRRLKAWLAKPAPESTPYLIVRPSFKAPVDHYLIGTLDCAADMLRVESYVPIDPVVRNRWWQLPVVFRGAWVTGDAANAAHIDGPPPRQPAWLKWLVRAMRFVWG